MDRPSQGSRATIRSIPIRRIFLPGLLRHLVHLRGVLVDDSPPPLLWSGGAILAVGGAEEGVEPQPEASRGKSDNAMSDLLMGRSWRESI